MNHRIILYRLSIAVAIGMLVAAFAYRAKAPSRPIENPLIVDSAPELSALELRNENNSSQIQQQDRLARLQMRF